MINLLIRLACVVPVKVIPLRLSCLLYIPLMVISATNVARFDCPITIAGVPGRLLLKSTRPFPENTLKNEGKITKLGVKFLIVFYLQVNITDSSEIRNHSIITKNDPLIFPENDKFLVIKLLPGKK